MIHRVRSLVAVLALGLPAVAAADRAPTPTPPKAAVTPVSAYLQQDKYTYCDVKILSALWKQSIADSKVTVGAKIQAKNDAFLTAELTKARQAAQKNPAARCKFSEAGFTYDDAVKLSKAWKNTAAQAKALAEDKILGGAEKYVRDLVKNSGGAEDPTSTFLKQDKFTYCDVKLLSALWKASTSDAKARIGIKIQTKNEAFLKTELESARKKNPTVRCDYGDAGLTFADVEKIAKVWKVTVAQAKATIEQKATSGNASYLHELVGGGASATDKELHAFLNQKKYTYCDAKMIAGMWKQSVEEGKTTIGLKLMSKNTRALTKIVTDARTFAKKNADARCSFYDAGFTYDDAVKLAAAWKKTEGEAKARVEDMITKGQEASVRATLKSKAAKAPPKPTQPAVAPPPPPKPSKPATATSTK